MFNILRRNIISATIKNNTVNTILLTGIYLFLPALLISISRSSFTGWSLLYTLQIGIYVAIILTYLFRNKLRLFVKVYVLQISIFLVAVTGLHSFGYLASAKLFFILIPIFFWFFEKRSVAIIATIISIATFTLYGYLFTHGLRGIIVNVETYTQLGAAWVTYGFVMLSIAIFCIVLFSELMDAQRDAYSRIMESEEKHRFLTDNIKDIIWVLDAESRKFTYVSPSIERILGYTINEFMEKEFTLLIPEENMPTIGEHTQDSSLDVSNKKESDYYTTEMEVPHKNGHTIWMEIISHYRKNPRANRGEVIGTSRDITERKKAQQAHEKSEERYKLATAASNMGIWDWFTASDEVYFSPMWKKQIGYEPHELEPKFSTWIDHLHPEERAGRLKDVDDYMANPVGKFILEFRFRHKNGSYIWIHSRAETIIDEKGKVVRLYGTHLDITKLKMNEDILIEKNRTLQKINSELDNFVYRVSHDIRAPLSSCFGILNLLEKENLVNEDNEQYIKLLKDVLVKQETVIKSILDYSRNSRSDLLVDKIPLREMILATFNDLKFMNNTRGVVELDVSMPADFSFFCDKNRVQFILNNLLSNGIKYADLTKDKPKIEVHAVKNNHAVSITVTDNGIGIHTNILPHIFEMFYRGNIESSGSGLGLYIVKETVEKLGGTIQVASEFELFTSFTITLPQSNDFKSLRT
jgi:PAS domain S-box-containing protein